jgi:hypothetical protein
VLVVSRPIGKPCYCLVCWEQVLWLPVKNVFDDFNTKLKARFGIDCSAWDISKEPFPICKDCTKNFQQFFKEHEVLKALQLQMEGRVKDMRAKVQNSVGKCGSKGEEEEGRIKAFRDRILSLRGKKRRIY